MTDMDSSSESACSEMDERRLTLLASDVLLLLQLTQNGAPSHQETDGANLHNILYWACQAGSAAQRESGCVFLLGFAVFFQVYVSI